MADFLVFQLYGALASWGDIAVGEYRPSQGHPSKSAITGLVAAALGIEREDDAAHVKLAHHYGVAVCVRADGEWLRDYHTAQVPGGDKDYVTRRQELVTDKPRLNTVLSQRDYRTDAFYQIAIWLIDNAAPYSLEALYYALRRPKFSLYLGRRSCPAGLPMYPRLILSVTLKQAFDDYPLDRAEPWLKQLKAPELIRYVWERRGLKTEEEGMSSIMRYSPRDKVVSRKRWQFTHRAEYYHAESVSGE